MTAAPTTCHTLFRLQLTELARVLEGVRDEEFGAAASLIVTADAVFVTGAGRNGLAMRAFANRLMQLGKPTFIIGDLLTGPIRPGGLLVIASASGASGSLVAAARTAREHRARVLALTACSDSPLAQQADRVLTIPAIPPGTPASAQPLGTLFEQALGLVCDALVLDLMRRLDVTTRAMRDRHANIE